jgi:fimbrial chaperone protein
VKKVIYSALLFIAAFSGNALAQPGSGGFGIDATRIIYNENDAYATIKVHNSTSDLPFIIKSLVTEYRPLGDKSPPQAPFEATPPLFRLEPGKESIIRIKRTGGAFPSDRESVYAFYAIAIPATEKPRLDTTQISGSIPIAVGNRIKLFWRPATLAKTAKEKQTALVFTRTSAGKIDIYNSSPYYVSLNNLVIGSQQIPLKNSPLEMIAPLTHVSAPIKAMKGEHVSWKAINDLGGMDNYKASIQ